MIPQIFPRFPEQFGPPRLSGLDAVKDFSERAVEELAPRKHQKRPNRSGHSGAQIAGWLIVAEGAGCGFFEHTLTYEPAQNAVQSGFINLELLREFGTGTRSAG